MNNPKPLVGMSHLEYDLTDLFDETEHLDHNLVAKDYHYDSLQHSGIIENEIRGFYK